MYLEIVTPDEKLFEGETSLVGVPGTDGSFTMLNNHAPIISTLDKGKIKVVDSGQKEQFFEIKSGVVEMNNNRVIILAETN
jgi:F-type H+-transporting ATPase subunit epsilon